MRAQTRKRTSEVNAKKVGDGETTKGKATSIATKTSGTSISESEPSSRAGPNNSIDNKKKTTITLALDDNVVEAIRGEAKELEQSLNGRINAILRKHVSFWRDVELNGAAIIPHHTHEFIVREVNEQKYCEEMKKIGNGLISFLLEQKAIPLTLEDVAGYVFGELCVNGGSIKNYSLYVDARDGKTCLFFRHDYDEKWSRILAEAFPDFLNRLFQYHMQTRVFPNGLEVKILDKLN